MRATRFDAMFWKSLAVGIPMVAIWAVSGRWWLIVASFAVGGLMMFVFELTSDKRFLGWLDYQRYQWTRRKP